MKNYDNSDLKFWLNNNNGGIENSPFIYTSAYGFDPYAAAPSHREYYNEHPAHMNEGIPLIFNPYTYVNTAPPVNQNQNEPINQLVIHQFAATDNEYNGDLQNIRDSNNEPLTYNPLFDFDTTPPGIKFCPYDRELIIHYLSPKIYDQPLPPNKIYETNLYSYDPQHLADRYPINGVNEWYFFTKRDRKYPNGERPNRAAGRGYWKATGADKKIYHKKKLIGFRKALVYYIGKPPRGDKTDWIMKEYRIVDPPKRVRIGENDMTLDDCVLCKIYKKKDRIKTLSYHQDVESDYEQEDI